MKLYTEEEVVKLLDKYTVLTKIGAEFYLNKMTPIKLPSDEEIKKTMMDFDEFDPYDVTFLGGAIWMRNKIQGGKK